MGHTSKLANLGAAIVFVCHRSSQGFSQYHHGRIKDCYEALLPSQGVPSSPDAMLALGGGRDLGYSRNFVSSSASRSHLGLLRIKLLRFLVTVSWRHRVICPRRVDSGSIPSTRRIEVQRWVSIDHEVCRDIVRSTILQNQRYQTFIMPKKILYHRTVI